MSSWVNTPGVVVTSVALYIISGLMIELIYRKLVWGEINPEMKNGRDPQPDTAIQEWTSFQESDPPDGKPIQVRCADGVVRIAKAYGMKDGRLLFDITFEVDVSKESQENQMKFRPTHWRDLDDIL
jgi:hypothetical protein